VTSGSANVGGLIAANGKIEAIIIDLFDSHYFAFDEGKYFGETIYFFNAFKLPEDGDPVSITLSCGLGFAYYYLKALP
jgi:hypothetical protein